MGAQQLYDDTLRARCAVPAQVRIPMEGVDFTGGRMGRAFDTNLAFLRKRFDLDRMLYWYRVHAGLPAPSVPYAGIDGHFENNLKGQTASEFLMGAGSALLYREDPDLRARMDALIAEMARCADPDGFLIPIDRADFRTKEYPNYVRAWLHFGLIAAGYAGNEQAFVLLRRMSDCFNHSEVLPFVKDMNLGFQGILASTQAYLSPAGVPEDLQVAVSAYEEPWWLEQIMAGDHRAIYDHPGNHPHSTLLTTLEGYFDIYFATGEQRYLAAIDKALAMYADKWQHVGGGIVMCEFDTYYPGVNWLSPPHSYNELCSSTFWILLHQRMHLLRPEEERHTAEIEKSLYNMVIAAQEDDLGLHYRGYLEKHKDERFIDVGTCCAATGTRILGRLPQYLFSYDDAAVYVNLYADAEAALPLAAGPARIRTHSALPYAGSTRIEVLEAPGDFALKLRIPGWAQGDTPIRVNGRMAAAVPAGRYHTLTARAGDVIELDFTLGFTATLYTGAEEIPGKERYALCYGPLLLAAMGPSVVELTYDPAHPDEWLSPIPGKPGRFTVKGDSAHELWPYMDIRDEPFSVYPVVHRP